LERVFRRALVARHWRSRRRQLAPADRGRTLQHTRSTVHPSSRRLLKPVDLEASPLAGPLHRRSGRDGEGRWCDRVRHQWADRSPIDRMEWAAVPESTGTEPPAGVPSLLRRGAAATTCGVKEARHRSWGAAEHRRQSVRTSFAVAVVVLCATVRRFLEPSLQEQGVYLAFIIPVALSAYAGGAGPGIVSAALSAATASPLLTDLRGPDPDASLIHRDAVCNRVCCGHSADRTVQHSRADAERAFDARPMFLRRRVVPDRLAVCSL